MFGMKLRGGIEKRQYSPFCNGSMFDLEMNKLGNKNAGRRCFSFSDFAEKTEECFSCIEYETRNDGNCFFWAFLQSYSGIFKNDERITLVDIDRLRRIISIFISENKDLSVVKRYKLSRNIDMNFVQAHEEGW